MLDGPNRQDPASASVKLRQKDAFQVAMVFGYEIVVHASAVL